MILKLLSPRKALNKAYLKVKPTRREIEHFKNNLVSLLDGLDESESEEHNKNDLGDFLKNTFYSPTYYINTKDRTDLVIHTGKDSKSSAGVLIEAKKPSNKHEMIRPDNLNAKAFHELILYYLRERIGNHNLEIKHLVATNIFEWFIFDASLFEHLFAQNKALVKQFTDFEEGRLADKSTDFFYKEIAEPFVREISTEICFGWFDFRDYDKPLRNEDKQEDTKFIALFKVLSPEHLLKLPFANDSNSLDRSFYSELLHIIGLSEIKSGNKKLIGRKKEGERNIGSLLENTMVQIDTRDKVNRLPKPLVFGKTYQEQLFNVSLELVITWLNRVLFLKLLEAQLIRYHKGDRLYGFLNNEKVSGYDALDRLFFRVLAKKTGEREPEIAKIFEKVPFLNSSLFEPTELEHQIIFISNLEDDRLIPLHSSTVLKDTSGKRRTVQLKGLDYLFQFLDAYDFSGEGAEEIQEDNKTLINASVLGLIFEKINGYKDGSYFTPGFITMYMCRETIRRAVVQKFNEAKGWKCEDMDQVYNQIEDRQEANKIINRLKICDPAVGSGHFLVSALNEIIAIKSDLKILMDREGRRLKEYHIEVVNDELIVTGEEGELFEYNPANRESQRIQQALFHEKQTIIENCLFGVDINQNSVKICRLRLWIELLKNAYYLTPPPPGPLPQEGGGALETLPNIDINIKCGNSLISRYALDADIKQALKKSKWGIFSYRNAIMSYRNATSKEQKRELERLITIIKSDFQSWISQTDPDKRKLDKLNSEKISRFTGTFLFEPEAGYGDKKNQEKRRKTQKELDENIEKYKKKVDDKLNSIIFENAFEWRFEFPEVLNDDGDFVGFDVVIGNPPYILVQNQKDLLLFDYYLSKFKTATYKIDTYHLFYELGHNLLKINGFQAFISPNTFLKNKHAKNLRDILLHEFSLIEIINFYYQVFEDASVDTLILIAQSKQTQSNKIKYWAFTEKSDIHDKSEIKSFKQNQFEKDDYEFEFDLLDIDKSIFNKIYSNSEPLRKFGRAYFGIQTKDRTVYVKNSKENDFYVPVIDGSNIFRYYYKPSNEFVLNKPEAIKSGGDNSVYSINRIAVRQIGSNPEGTIVPSGLYTLNTIYNIFFYKEDEYTLIFLLGLLNSKLYKFIWLKRYYDNKATFPKIKKAPLESLPLPKITLKEQEKVNKIVGQINDMKKSNSSADITALEAKIDRLVYGLYGLTEEEIKIVEGN